MSIVSASLARAKRVSLTSLLRISAVFTILGLAAMVWSLFVPTPMPVIVAMTVGQGFGIFAFLLYLVAIIIDVRRDAQRDGDRENV
ncbi:MAG TPA: hypothetical protein VK427_07010 [Kofleriaceae bacterium]|nr:hypothetical protein [Kofleriaceae bacterium]